jgi:predicted dehydrogenase
VLGGKNYTAPSDQITVANIGCGTQGLRELPGLLENEEIRVVAVCDPNTFSTDYIDWSPFGIRNGIRRTLQDPQWGADLMGIPGGRDLGKKYVDDYYRKFREGSEEGDCKSYEDFRVLLEEVSDIDVVKIMTPDHLHAPIALAAMDKGIHVVTHKPVANRLLEGRKVLDKEKESGVITHLLAWSERPEHELTLKWILDGEIGELREIHNWSYRPVWPQWTENPTEEVAIPDGFNWDLWLGPVPDRPYHPNYAHNVFRGWYDFGGGSIADMGHYSLFPLFQSFGINTSPVAAKAYGSTSRKVMNGVSMNVNNTVAFPASCMIKLEFPVQDKLPSFDLYWYDGGMKPFAPDELLEDGLDTPTEGMMFVGSKGKILAGFLGEQPRLIPQKRMENRTTVSEVENERRSNTWSRAIQTGTESPGSFRQAKVVTDTINLAAVALRARSRIEFDSNSVRITNNESANKLLSREYREGWEI